MLNLSPEADDLVQAGRASLRPTDADRERVLQALLPRIGSGPAPSPSGFLATKATLVKALAVVIGLGLAGVGLFLSLHADRPPEKPAVVQPAPPPVPPAVIAQPPELAPPVVPQAQPVKRPAVAARADSLAQEVEILSRASSELHAGRAAAALAALAEHQRKFPSGVLVEERSAARVQALCALGRNQEARAELARLARMWPNSPHEARARKACGFTGNESE